MSNLLPDKLLKQRFKLQLQSLDSPSDFSNARSTVDPGVSPMTDLAMNLNDTSLNSLTPVQDSKRRLSMGSDTSTPSPEDKLSSLVNLNHTPLTSLTNKPRRINQPSRLSFKLHGNDDNDPEANKENMPFPLPSSGGKKSPTKGLKKSSPAKVHSGKPERTRKVAIKTGSLNFAKMSPSPNKVSIIPRKMSAPAAVNFSCLTGDLIRRQSPSKKPKSLMKKPDFQILDDVEDSCSRDSGFNSQDLLDDFGAQAKTVKPASMEDILASCSPGKDEDGVTPLKSSPERGGKDKEVKSKTDGFDFFALDTIAEDKQEDSPCIDLSSLLSNKIMMSDVEMEKNKSELPTMAGLFHDSKESQENSFKETRRLFNGGNQKRGKIRRALSMLDRPACAGSPVSRFNVPIDLTAAVSRFKRPEPPRPEFGEDVSNKRQRIDTEVSSITTKITSNSIEFKRSSTTCNLIGMGGGGGGPSRPKFFRSFSENELSVMKSCELKENVDNILPDSSRLYSLPAIEDKRNPSLRSLSCHTLAQLIKGEFNHVVNSFRIIDCRYAYEYTDGHIRHAENWQHGEDEEFLNEFLPKDPLPGPPAFNPGCQKKRDILIFHCEFSSQRGPDFYRKLREKDRTLNQHVYPALHHPEIYLLHLGYKQFYSHFPDLCVGSYTTMDDPRHQESYREMRSKSKSWSGGTIMRTGKLNRNLIM